MAVFLGCLRLFQTEFSDFPQIQFDQPHCCRKKYCSGVGGERVKGTGSYSFYFMLFMTQLPLGS